MEGPRMNTDDHGSESDLTEAACFDKEREMATTMLSRAAILTLAFFCCLAPLGAQSAPGKSADPAWKKLAFLLGEWTGSAGEKDTPLGAGQGDFSFQPELNRKIIVRRNQAAYDSGVRHEDLMVIYGDALEETPRAIFFDSEGHVIRYNLTFPAPNRVTFESEPGQAGPRYRLSYWMEGRALAGKFEVAPPGADFKTYMSWRSKKKE